MEIRKLDLVLDLRNLKSFKRKAFRDSYISGRVRTSIALQIRELRRRLGLTQKQFAEKIGKAQTAVSRLESTEYGRLTVQTLLDIAEALDIAVVVKFASFDEFLNQHGDVTPDVLAVKTYRETVASATQLASQRAASRAFEYTEVATSGANVVPFSPDPSLVSTGTSIDEARLVRIN